MIKSMKSKSTVIKSMIVKCDEYIMSIKTDHGINQIQCINNDKEAMLLHH